MSTEHDQSWKLTGLTLDRNGSSTLVDLISGHIEKAITEGTLPPGSRLPSWRDLAAQLVVGRGTVRAAYEKLIDKQLLVTAGSAGTRVVDTLPHQLSTNFSTNISLLPKLLSYRTEKPLVFQMGVPAGDTFPGKLWSRLYRQAVQVSSLQIGYSDPRGIVELRTAIASHVAIARGIHCSPEQVVITSGFRGGIATVLRALNAEGRQAWIEDPGYPVTRIALEFSGVHPVSVQVDKEGLNVEKGKELAPRAALAFVTPGQQAPSGVTMTSRRRNELLQWARETGAWIVEDDYLAELHLAGRPANALASGFGSERVIHMGTFSKTISPALGVGFIIAPPPIARRVVEVATWLGAPPNLAVQMAVVRFLREGHYLRHLRRMRRLYNQRRQKLATTLKQVGINTATPSGLSIILRFANGFDDQLFVQEARANGLGPAPLSPWFSAASRSHSGLILGVTNVLDQKVLQDCQTLRTMIYDAGAIPY